MCYIPNLTNDETEKAKAGGTQVPFLIQIHLLLYFILVSTWKNL